MKLMRNQRYSAHLIGRVSHQSVLAAVLIVCTHDILADTLTADRSTPEPSRPSVISIPALHTKFWQLGRVGSVQSTNTSGISDQYIASNTVEELSLEHETIPALAEDRVFVEQKTKSVKSTKNLKKKEALNSYNEPTISLPPVTVTAKRQDNEVNSPYNTRYNRLKASTGTKTDTPIMETPVSIQVVPRQVLRDQQVISLDQALHNVSGVIANPGIEGDEVSTRGFANAFIFRDGARLPSGDLNSQEETVHLDRIEVLKGPGAILFGQMEPGGMVNQVSKQPLAEPYYELAQQFGSFNFYRTTIDAGGALLADPGLKYRFNLAYENAGSFVDLVENNRIFVAPVLRWDISPTTQFTIQLQYKDSLDPLKVSIPFIGTRPAPVPRNTDLGEPGLGNHENQVYGGFHWSHAFNQDWTISHRFFASRIEQSTRRIVSATDTPLGGTSLKRLGTDVYSQQNYYYTTLNLTGHFDTGKIAHTLLLGGDYTGQDGGLRSRNFLYQPIDVFRPIHDINRKLSDSLGEVSGFDAYGFYVQDQAHLPFDLYALAGFRYDRVRERTEFVQRTLDQPLLSEGVQTVADDALTPRFGLLWRPLTELSFYGSYTENFGASSDPSTTGRPLPPETAQQWEVGIKTSLFDGRLTGSLALFDLIKQNVARPDPANPRFSIAIGEARHRGMEIDLAGEVTPGCNIIGSYAYLDSEITKDSAKKFNDTGQIIGVNDGATGNRLAGTPRHTGSMWASCELTEGRFQGLKLGAGVIARSQNFADQANNALRLPGYATVNLMFGYARNIGPSTLSFQLNIDNLLDKTYFESSSPVGANYGTTRTFLGSVRIEF